MHRQRQLAAVLTPLLLLPSFGQMAESVGDARDGQMSTPEKEQGGQQADASHLDHEGMHMPGMNHGMKVNQAGMFLMKMASGTSMNPQSWPMPMFMPRVGSWNLMFMGQAFIVETDLAHCVKRCYLANLCRLLTWPEFFGF